MSDQKTWVEALNISPEMLNQWSQAAPSGTPLLVWCLTEGHISVAEYLGWAREHFALPVLSSAFFESDGFDPSYLRSPDATSTWQPWCFPVARWENLTYVACVEPPRETPIANTVYILADPRVLHEAWEAETNDSASLDQMEAAPTPAPAALTESDGPMGITITTAKSNFKLSLGDEGQMLGGDIFAKSEAAEEEPAAKTQTFVMEDAIEVQVNSSRSEPSVLESDFKLPEELEVKAASVKATAPAKAKEPEAQTRPLKVAPAPAASTVPAAPAVEPRSEYTSAGTTTTTEAEMVASTISFLTQSYAYVAVFKLVEGVAVYQYGDKNLKINKGKKPTLDLSFPSFLRVVYRTEHPYHGYLVDTPTHHEFFQELGLNFLPACVTAVPIRFNGQIWGIMVAIGDEKNRSNDNIAIVEKANAQLVQNMGPIWSNAG